MFCEVELYKDVAIRAENLKRKGADLKRCIITYLLKNIKAENASRDRGYFLAVTSLKSMSMSKRETVNEMDIVFFRVVFSCRTFLPVRGEILDGVVHHVSMHGVFLKSGPIRCAFLSARKMPDYHYVAKDNEKPHFLSGDLSKIEEGVAVRFMVLAVRCVKKRGQIQKEFIMLASLDGRCLGPISLAGSDDFHL